MYYKKKLKNYLQELLAVKRIRALFFIFIFLFLGEVIRYFFDLPVAGSIIGMVLLFLALKRKIIKLEDVKPASDKLLEYLVLFFIPYGVGLMVYFDLVQAHWLPIFLALFVSTLLTLYITAIVLDRFRK